MRKRKGLPWALSGWIHSVSALYSRLSVPRRHSIAAVATLLTVVWLLSPSRRACPVRAPASLLHHLCRPAIVDGGELTRATDTQSPLDLPFSPELARWQERHSSSFPFASQPAGPSPAQNFTVVLNTFKRRKLLLRALSHYATCGPQVASIRVVWSEQAPAPQVGNPDDRPFFLQSRQPRPRDVHVPVVSYDTYPTTSLNNRFEPLAGLLSEAVFSVDDDMVIPCATLRDAFAAWRAAPYALVGFYPRVHEPLRVPPRCKAGQAVARYRYISAEPALWVRGKYSLVLTKAAFLHSAYLEMYTHAMPRGIREHVSRHRECEDIAMAFLVANATRRGHSRGVVPSVWVRPPVAFWLGAKVDGVGRKGISAGQVKDHHSQRGDCVSYFTRFYDDAVPLVTVPLRNSAPRAMVR